MKMLQASDYNYNIGETVASLHDIYRVKSNSVAFGTALIALYMLSVAASFVLA